MLGWLKQKAIVAAQNQCRTNIKLSTKSLILVADEVDASIQSMGDSTESQKNAVVQRQQQLFQELCLSHSNEMSVDEIKSMLDSLLGQNASTDGARMAVQHSYQSFLNEVGESK